MQKKEEMEYEQTSAAKITRTLIEEKVPIPAWFNFTKYGTFAHVFDGADENKIYAWSITSEMYLKRRNLYWS